MGKCDGRNGRRKREVRNLGCPFWNEWWRLKYKWMARIGSPKIINGLGTLAKNAK